MPGSFTEIARLLPLIITLLAIIQTIHANWPDDVWCHSAQQSMHSLLLSAFLLASVHTMAACTTSHETGQ